MRGLGVSKSWLMASSSIRSQNGSSELIGISLIARPTGDKATYGGTSGHSVRKINGGKHTSSGLSKSTKHGWSWVCQRNQMWKR
jgi:hypothetical protein